MKLKSMLVAVVMTSLSTFAFAGCETAAAVTSENRLIENNFYGLIVRSNAHVILSQGDVASVRVEGDANNVSAVETSVENGSLVIQGKNETPVTIYVTMGDISLIEVEGNGKIYGNQVINADILLLKVVGTGSINVDIRALSLGMIVRGKGKIYVTGSTGDSFTRVSGNGRIIDMNLDSFKTSFEADNDQSYSKKNSNGVKHHALKLHF